MEDRLSPFGFWDCPRVNEEVVRLSGHMSAQERRVGWEVCQGSGCYLGQGRGASQRIFNPQGRSKDSLMSCFGWGSGDSGIEGSSHT